MFLVGGGIVTHAIPPLHDVVHHWSEALGAVGAALPTLVDFVAGILTGAVVLGAWSTVQRLRGKSAH
jgi:predicted DNA repair protein MutK